jgi:hypothetical protein
MVKGEYERVCFAAISAGMSTEILINVFTVLFSGVEFCDTIYVLYSVRVVRVTLTPSLLLTLATIPLRKSLLRIPQIEFTLGFPYLLCQAKPFIGMRLLIVKSV